MAQAHMVVHKLPSSQHHFINIWHLLEHLSVVVRDREHLNIVVQDR